MTSPTQFFILGGGGDLAQRKLFPALFDLYIQKLLPATFQIIGLARTERSDEEYQSLIREAILRQQKSYSETDVDAFCAHAHYVSGSFEDEETFEKLQSVVSVFQKESGFVSNKIFYLAVPPAHYEHIFELLNKSGIAENNSDSWSRILIEKPFGHDTSSAEALNNALTGLFNEEHIYRIDHYLAKEAIQNLLAFRFSNTLIRNGWSKDAIEAVHITMLERVNVASRGAFYDKVGALRDVGQNHLLQMMALIAMDEPEVFDAEHIRENRASLLQTLIPIPKDEIKERVVRAQYAGYTETSGVDKASHTETYFEFKAYLNHEKWTGVPFYIQAGKALKNDEVTIKIDFKDVTNGPFASSGNAIILTVSPVQSMNLTVNVKRPGHQFAIEENTLSFAWDEEHRGVVNAYEKVILDCINGDKTLFTTTEEILASWEFIRSIVENWDQIPLQFYEEGSAGPVFSII